MSLRDESGMTVIELLAGIIGFIVLFGAIMEMTIVATHNQERIAHRVGANQRARPALTSVMDQIRSGCVAPRAVPIQQGSTSTQMSYLSRTGSSVNPTPDRRVLTLSGTTLFESIYPATGGTPPVWTFSGTPLAPDPRTVMTGVSAPGGVMFRYYDYVNGQLNATPLPVPLSATNAARAAFVSVTLNVLPARDVRYSNSPDAGASITLTDSADLRLESAAQVGAVDNPPCT
jgi:hypothetical protein